MNAHVFNVSERTFPVHRDRGFCGIGKPGTPLREYRQALEQARTFSGMITDLKGTRRDDLVFFYESGRGFHGVYKILTPPFFDPQDIFGTGEFETCKVGADLPFRLPIRCVDYFPNPVPEDLIFSTPEYERIFWIPFYRKIQGPRGCITIDPEAKCVLLELLIKMNGPSQSHDFVPFYHDSELGTCPVSHSSDEGSLESKEEDANRAPQLLEIPLEPGKPVPLEDYLRGWLAGHLDDPTQSDLRRIFGPVSHVEWFANNVPYHVSRRNIDLLIYHRTPPSELMDRPLRYKYSVVELKRDAADPQTIEQVIGYAKWVAHRLANGEVDIVRPYVIAQHFQAKSVELARSIRFNRTGIRLVEYEVTGKDSIAFHDVA